MTGKKRQRPGSLREMTAERPPKFARKTSAQAPNERHAYSVNIYTSTVITKPKLTVYIYIYIHMYGSTRFFRQQIFRKHIFRQKIS